MTITTDARQVHVQRLTAQALRHEATHLRRVARALLKRQRLRAVDHALADAVLCEQVALAIEERLAGSEQ